jgi:NAD(P)-dependent dehydrogenase (short-subunit alcohol dehydrogenase family)
MATVIITGTSSGIGRLATETLARAGHTVYATMRALDGHNRPAALKLEQLAHEEHLPIRTLEMDVQNSDSVRRAIDQTFREAGRIDVVVNNAGHMSIGLAEGFTDEQVARQLDVNFMGPVRVCRSVLPHLRAQGSGLIIHVTSIVAGFCFPGAPSTAPANLPTRRSPKSFITSWPELEWRASS